MAFGSAFAVVLGGVRVLAWNDEPLASRLKRVMAFDPHSARAIYAAFVARAPAERDLEDLVSGVIACDGLRSIPFATLSDADLRQHLMQRIRDDFGCGNTINLDGWVLSRTEVRLCGIIALV